MEKQIVQCDLANKTHAEAFIKLMNAYMEHPMGISQSIKMDHAEKIIADLIQHPTYLGVMVQYEGEYVGLANCFINYSTFKGKPLINIHDFIVLPEYRNKGLAQLLLYGIEAIGKEKGCCRINLEVRHDNHSAMKLYKKVGYIECDPPMYFWEKYLD